MTVPMLSPEGEMNRKQRREAARRAAKALHLKGSEKAAAVRGIASQFKEQREPEVAVRGEQLVEEGTAGNLTLRKSGLFAVRRKGLGE